ncbi:malate dehydrogenase [Halorussus sp. AFM4]|uniref:malate dehydrogenase n=1 Tax=Halorussus sp. AFM4 TaxID=3421651 RepID=UPI003EB7243B
MHVTVIGGAGSVGSTVAYTLAVTVPDVSIRLVDVEGDAAAGHATDIEHAMNHDTTHAAGRAVAADVRGGSGPVEIAEPGPDVVDDTDCIVAVYNVSRPAEAVGRGGRDAYFQRNKTVADELGEWMADVDPRPVVVVTNPVDRITHRLWRASRWPRRSFVGYSLSETARAAAELGRLRDADPGDVRCPMMGEHGEHVVPIFSKTTVGGNQVSLDEEERQRVVDYVRDVPYEVMEQRGADESSRWVSGRGAAAVVHAILTEGTDEPVCLSVPLKGEYGYEDVCMSVPVTLSAGGWDEIEHWELSDWEQDRLNAAYRHLAETDA